MSFALSASRQLEDNALRDAQGIDLVIGTMGSPLQLILSSIYHIDVPTGNIPRAAQAQLAQNRMVKKVIPLALGNSYRGFHIVGTNTDYIAHYNGTPATGRLFNAPLEAVFDRLVLTPVESVWRVHEIVHGIDVNDKGKKEAMHAERELTVLLVQYASPLAALSMPRMINSQSELQAAQPAFEAAKLFRLLGVGIDVLRAIAAIVLATAVLSMFVALYNALEERKTDLAILRTLVAPPFKLLLLLLAEGLLLALAGALLGWALGHAAVDVLGRLLSDDQNLNLSGWIVAPEEAWLALAAIGVGLLAALLPAIRAYRTDIAATLAR